MQTNTWTKGKRFRFGLISTLLVLLLLEGIFRIVFYIQHSGYHTSVYIQGNTLQVSDRVLIFRNRPFYLDYNRRYQFNEAGMKSVPGNILMPVKTANDYWVFLFGASAMEGMGSNKNGEWQDITGITDYAARETIAARLEKILQDSLPAKKVRVFNAANSAFTIQQSFLRYQQLSAQYKMDWVISMDGHNEPPVLLPGATVRQYLQDDWNSSALFKFPLNAVIAVTSHSALANQVKQFVFNQQQTNRLAGNQKKQYPRRTYWLQAHAPQLAFADYTTNIKRAIDSFYAQLLQFDALLSQKKQSHLLLIQPYLAFRDTTLMQDTEKALWHYFLSAHNEPDKNTFLREVTASFSNRVKGSQPIRLLNDLDHLPKPVFVDYCHLTPEANQYVARQIASYILNSR